jgi:hypothetical protein
MKKASAVACAVVHNLKSHLSQEPALKYPQKPMLDSPSRAAQPRMKHNTSIKTNINGSQHIIIKKSLDVTVRIRKKQNGWSTNRLQWEIKLSIFNLNMK